MKSNKVGNSPKSELNHEKLKTYKGFENTTEEQAEKQIAIIKRLAKILYYLYMNEQQKNNYKTE